MFTTNLQQMRQKRSKKKGKSLHKMELGILCNMRIKLDHFLIPHFTKFNLKYTKDFNTKISDTIDYMGEFKETILIWAFGISSWNSL